MVSKEIIRLKKDSLFFLSTNGFKDSFSAFNFSSNLPISVPLKTIYTDTTWETIERPKIYYSIQILATPYKDTLNAFQRKVKKKLQGFHTNVVFKDSLLSIMLDYLILKRKPLC